MKLVTKIQWNALKTKNLPTNITPQFGGVAIHYMGGKGKATPSSHLKCAGIVQSIQKDHIHVNGWLDIAYSFLVCTHGYVYEGRGLHKRTAANKSAVGNQNYYAVCALINEADELSPELLQGIKDACQFLRTRGSAGDSVQPHKKFTSTDCPGTKLSAEVQKGTFTRPKVAVDNSYPGTPLQKGSTGKYVEKLQKRLDQLGYHLKDDGKFGNLTYNAVRAYQTDTRITVDGIAGSETWDHLF